MQIIIISIMIKILIYADQTAPGYFKYFLQNSSRLEI